MKKNKKKGFTLVELLAVIVILAVILIIAIPQIMNTIKTSRLKTIESSARLIAKEAEGDFLSQKTINPDYNIMSIPCTDVAKLSDDYDSCDIVYNSVGVATIDLVGKSTGKFKDLHCSGTKDEMHCQVEYYSISKKYCTYSGELSKGVEFIDGDYTYRYMQESVYNEWQDINLNGWGVSLTNPDSTAPIETQVCSYINGIPIVSMSHMFSNSNSNSVNFDNFDTRNVTNMSNMFSYTKFPIDFSSFNTSKVTNMKGMFYGSSQSELNMTTFDTRNVTNMSEMFADFAGEFIDISSFDTSKVTNMSTMFSFCSATINGIDSLNTSNVTNMSMMFAAYRWPLNLRNFDTSNVTNMSGMFIFNISRTFLDLSSFDTSNVENMSNMFHYSGISNGYARTETDANRLNANTSNPENKIFKVANIKECTYNGKLEPGATFIDEAYTYKYKQELQNTIWKNISTDGWGVALTNKDSTDNVTTIVCSYINNKPIVSTSYMYSNSNSKYIDLNLFDTWNVVNMQNMFSKSKVLNINGFEKLNVNNVKDMSKMFYDSAIEELDVSNFALNSLEKYDDIFLENSLKKIYVSDENMINILKGIIDNYDEIEFIVK